MRNGATLLTAIRRGRVTGVYMIVDATFARQRSYQAAMRFKAAALVMAAVFALPAFAQRARVVSRQPELRDEVTTTANDSSCDITNSPAATLLIPYFQVSTTGPREKAKTTQFAVTNVSRQPQIARVTIWSDWSIPMIAFNLFLTGYESKRVDLYDVLVDGKLGSGTQAQAGPRSAANDGNPNFDRSAASACSLLPERIPEPLLTAIRNMLVTGKGTYCPQVGEDHYGNGAVGYVTIDVVATCSALTAVDPRFFSEELLFDNVLIGDYLEINATGDRPVAAATNMVHLRAVPEGGAAGSRADAVLPYTFYDRYTAGLDRTFARTYDRRQPLPATFAVHFLAGGYYYSSRIRLWREMISGVTASCSSWGMQPLPDFVRFDEHENASIRGNIYCVSPPPPSCGYLASVGEYSFSIAPENGISADAGGWLYVNLDNGGSAAYSSTQPRGYDRQVVRHSQNWLMVRDTDLHYYSTLRNAVPLGNGCSPAGAPQSHIGALP